MDVVNMKRFRCHRTVTHADSLSMLSPNPGVSTIVRAIRTPSSSSSMECNDSPSLGCILRTVEILANVDWFDSDSVFNVSGLWIVGYFVRQNLGLAKGVHEGCSPSSRSTLSRAPQSR